MILLYSCFDKPFEKDKFDSYLKQVPEWCRQKSLLFKRWQDRHTYLFGKLLLQRGLDLLKITDTSLLDYKIDIHGKPSFNKNLNFNISHSNNYVACVIDPKSIVGIDIEYIKTDINIFDFQQAFSKNEFQNILSAASPIEKLYTLWTIKESIIKADGRGINVIHLLDENNNDNGYLTLEDKKWFFSTFSIEDHIKVALASDVSISSVTRKKIVFD
ncbi:4'-phosphopantetheinyl transferase family protein [Dyadobacter diqingensis]|uniref:4'-phosphopantetheinyl transferase family protein n=1 Tax=Dyadobacter diqingensis TaxID=2938121 RepID=UPI0020C44857|nr:4'-phosphopantetheinyl transferase superfamily protein [Dyadobacter diqingensis]